MYTGLVAAAYTCLLINGFVGFQFAEDGTPLSLWVRPCKQKFKMPVLTYSAVPPDILPRRLRCQLLRRDRYFQGVRQFQLCEADWSLGHLHSVAAHMHRHLHCVSADPGLPDSRGPLAYWRHHLRCRLLHYRPSHHVRLQRDDLRRHQALHRWPFLLHTLHAPERYDGL